MPDFQILQSGPSCSKHHYLNKPVIGQNVTVLSTSFGKSFFCLELYTKEVNLQTFVMI